MNIVIAAAGRGLRLKEAGYPYPKPFVPVNGRPLIHWAFDSIFPPFSPDGLIVVCLKADADRYPVEAAIREYGINPRIKLLDQPTRGQAETVWMARELLKPDAPLVIYNCDTYMRLPSHSGRTDIRGGADGVVSVYPASDPSLSYVKTDEAGNVVAIREKEVISGYASTGLYYFAKASFFLEEVEKCLEREETDHGEYFVAPLYNRLISRGHRVHAEIARDFYPLGTPGQIRRFERAFPGRGGME